MAELSFLGYNGSRNLIQRLDARLKLAFMAVLSLLIFNTGPAAQLLAALATGGVLVLIRFRIGRFLREFKWLFAVLIALCLLRGLLIPGARLHVLAELPLSREGLVSGALFSGRLLLIVWLGLILSSTTPADRLRSAVEWYLAPLPFLRPHKIGLLIGLMLRFIPLIISQARLIGEAQRARCIENRKNPLFRLTVFSMALLRVAFAGADRLALAMEARCYADRPFDTAWKFCAGDLWALLLLIGLAAGMLWLS